MHPGTQTPPLVMRDQGLGELATRQHGVVSYRQLQALGFSDWAIKAALRRRRLLSLHGEVYAVGHGHVGQRGHWWAGVLAYGEEAVLSHRSAAALWGLVRERRIVEVTAPRGRQGVERRRWLWIHRCKLHAEDRTEQEGLPVMTVARTLFDYAEVVPFTQLERAWEEADRRNLLQLGAVERVCERGRGRRALKPIRRLLAEARAPAEGRSPLETRFARFRDQYALPPAATNVEVLGSEVDVLWPAARLVVELDSWEHHGHRAGFERDRARDPALLLAGYRTIRITHRRLDREPDAIAAEIRGLLTLGEREAEATPPRTHPQRN